MGTVVSRLMVRPLKNYNVENRAHKVISKPKPEPAPQYESQARQMKIVNECKPMQESWKINKNMNKSSLLSFQMNQTTWKWHRKKIQNLTVT